MVGTDVGVDMHVRMWAGIGEDTYSVSLLLSSFAFPYSMVFGCIRKKLHCYIQLALDICYISGRTKQSIEIENFFDWIVSTQCKIGGGNEVADYKKRDLTSRYHSSLKKWSDLYQIRFKTLLQTSS